METRVASVDEDAMNVLVAREGRWGRDGTLAAGRPELDVDTELFIRRRGRVAF